MYKFDKTIFNQQQVRRFTERLAVKANFGISLDITFLFIFYIFTGILVEGTLRVRFVIYQKGGRLS
jgi:hypothetical protein